MYSTLAFMCVNCTDASANKLCIIASYHPFHSHAQIVSFTDSMMWTGVYLVYTISHSTTNLEGIYLGYQEKLRPLFFNPWSGFVEKKCLEERADTYWTKVPEIMLFHRQSFKMEDFDLFTLFKFMLDRVCHIYTFVFKVCHIDIFVFKLEHIGFVQSVLPDLKSPQSVQIYSLFELCKFHTKMKGHFSS